MFSHFFRKRGGKKESSRYFAVVLTFSISFLLYRCSMRPQVEAGKLAISVLPWAEDYPGTDNFRKGPWQSLTLEQIVDRAARIGAQAFQAHHDEPCVVPAETKPWDQETIMRSWETKISALTGSLIPEAIAPRLWFAPEF